jgi:hypothetical protein
MFDRWTVLHFGSGFLMGALRVPAWFALLNIIGFEIFEAFLRSHPDHVPSFIPKGYLEYESQANILGDILAGLTGYGLGLKS